MKITDLNVLKGEIEVKIKCVEAIVEDLNKRVNQDTSLLNDLLAWNEGKLQACKEILEML